MIRKEVKQTLALIVFFLLVGAPSCVHALDLQSTGTNSASGGALAEGDIFTTEDKSATNEYDLYTGVWAHALIPTGQSGFALSERSVPASQEKRIITNFGASDAHNPAREYDLVLNYGSGTVCANVTKSSSMGSAEATAEISSRGHIIATNPLQQTLSGDALISASLIHTGTGSGSAYASGSSDYLLGLRGWKNPIDYESYVNGSASGVASLVAENTFGGQVIGYARKGATSLSQNESSGYTDNKNQAEAVEFLSTASGRISSDGQSNIQGSLSGNAQSVGINNQRINTLLKSYIFSQAITTGDLRSEGRTYRTGDSVSGKAATINPDLTQNLRVMTGPSSTTAWGNSILPSARIISKASQASSDDYIGASSEASTSSQVRRVSTDLDNEIYGDAYVADANMRSKTVSDDLGTIERESAFISVDSVNLGSGTHLFNRAVGAGDPASSADLALIMADGLEVSKPVDTLENIINDYYGTGTPGADLLSTNGPVVTGNVGDAAGSYIGAKNIRVYSHDDWRELKVKSISTYIDSINAISWISGDDSRTHVEPRYGTDPLVTQPISDPLVLPADGRGSFNIYGPVAVPQASITNRQMTLRFGVYQTNGGWT